MHKESFIFNRNTLLHVSTLLGYLQGELFYRYTKFALCFCIKIEFLSSLATILLRNFRVWEVHFCLNFYQFCFVSENSNGISIKLGSR
jgi:hypothetical protein